MIPITQRNVFACAVVGWMLAGTADDIERLHKMSPMLALIPLMIGFAFALRAPELVRDDDLG